MDYSKYFSKARVKISQYGGNVVITRKGTTTAYDKATNTYISNDIVINGKGILSSIDSQFINGTSILIGDAKLMCTLDSTPEINDKLKFGGKEYNVVNIDAVNPNGDCVIYYNLQVR